MIFEQTTDRILEALGTDVSRQRLDSTHIVSNMARLTRLGLFCETVRVFLRQVHKLDEGLYEQVPIGLRRRYVRDDGTDSGYADARSEQGRRRLKVCARDVYRLHRRFAGTAAAQLEGYGLLGRLLEQQCTVVSSDQGPGGEEDDGGEGPVPVLLKDPSQISADTLQSPHDPDATYSGHKGKGYEVPVCETCVESNEVQVITHVDVTPSCQRESAGDHTGAGGGVPPGPPAHRAAGGCRVRLPGERGSGPGAGHGVDQPGGRRSRGGRAP